MPCPTSATYIKDDEIVYNTCMEQFINTSPKYTLIFVLLSLFAFLVFWIYFFFLHRAFKLYHDKIDSNRVLDRVISYIFLPPQSNSDHLVQMFATDGSREFSYGKLTNPEFEYLGGLISIYRQQHGFGQMSYSNGEFYEGEFVRGYKCGKGSITYHNKLSYSGDWLKNKRHGNGIMLYGMHDEGDMIKYDGKWNNDKKCGLGIGYYRNGDVYKGGWINDSQYGFGILTKANGSEEAVEAPDCSICMQELHQQNSLFVLIHCSHVYHERCLISWIERSRTCPLCRSDRIDTFHHSFSY